MIGGGFIARCVFIYAEEKRQLTPYLSEVIPPDYIKTRGKLVQDLEHISLLRGQYKLLPETIAWGSKWYIEHNKKRPINLDDERFGTYLARKQTHIHKLAMVLAAAQRDELVITEKDLDEANQLVTVLEESMPKVFQQIGRTETSKHNAELIRYVQQRSVVPYTDLFRYMFRVFSTQREFDEAIAGAVRAGYITMTNEGGQIVVRAKRE
jgi:hypothetical protein